MARGKKGARGKKKVCLAQEEILAPITATDANPIGHEDKTREAEARDRSDDSMIETNNNASHEESGQSDAAANAENAFKTLMRQMENSTTQEEREALIKAYEASFGSVRGAHKKELGIFIIMLEGLKYCPKMILEACGSMAKELPSGHEYKSFVAHAFTLFFAWATNWRLARLSSGFKTNAEVIHESPYPLLPQILLGLIALMMSEIGCVKGETLLIVCMSLFWLCQLGNVFYEMGRSKLGLDEIEGIKIDKEENDG